MLVNTWFQTFSYSWCVCFDFKTIACMPPVSHSCGNTDDCSLIMSVLWLIVGYCCTSNRLTLIHRAYQQTLSTGLVRHFNPTTDGFLNSLPCCPVLGIILFCKEKGPKAVHGIKNYSWWGSRGGWEGGFSLKNTRHWELRWGSYRGQIILWNRPVTVELSPCLI